MTEQILVAFDGPGSGTGELTWGQLNIWPTMQSEHTSMSIGGAFPVSAGTTVDDIAASLSFLMSRFGALRTRIQASPGGQLLQTQVSSGQVALDVVDAGDADADDVAWAQYRRYESAELDYARDFPVRWAAVLGRGVVTHQVFAISHIAADGEGVMAMLTDLEHRDEAAAAGPAPGLAAVELARRQRTAAGQRKSRLAMAHWERLLREIPARRFAGTADAQEPRYWEAWFNSPASLLAAQVIAARTGVTTSTVLLAAFAVTISRLTQSNPVVVQVIVSNRFRRELADSVSPLAMPGLCAIDVAGADFDEIVRRAWRAAVVAYKNAYYDPREREELVRRVSAERGEEIDLDCGVNDRRLGPAAEPQGPPPDQGEVRAALAQSRLTWGFRRDRPNGRCFLHIDNVPGTVHYELRADTRYLTPADMEACLRGLELALAQAVLGETATDEAAAVRPAGAPAAEAGPIEAGLDPATGAGLGRD